MPVPRANCMSAISHCISFFPLFNFLPASTAADVYAFCDTYCHGYYVQSFGTFLIDQFRTESTSFFFIVEWATSSCVWYRNTCYPFHTTDTTCKHSAWTQWGLFNMFAWSTITAVLFIGMLQVLLVLQPVLFKYTKFQVSHTVTDFWLLDLSS